MHTFTGDLWTSNIKEKEKKGVQCVGQSPLRRSLTKVGAFELVQCRVCILILITMTVCVDLIKPDNHLWVYKGHWTKQDREASPVVSVLTRDATNRYI